MSAPIKYIERTQSYYRALGYDNPYEWAQNDQTPFTPLKKPLSRCQVAIITTAAPFQPGKGDQGPGAPYNGAAKFYDVYSAPIEPMPDLRISHLAIDRDHSDASDIGSWFPLAALGRAQSKGRIGQAAPNFYGLPTNRSHRQTALDAVDVVSRCLRDGIDCAILVPNCPVCHQSVSIAARALEAAGIACVIMACAFDIVERAGVPRFVFSDFPLGNSAGMPGDIPNQDYTLGLALDLLQDATGPNSALKSNAIWAGPANWKDDYSNPDKLSAEEIAKRRAKFVAGQAVAKAIRDGS